MCVTCGCGAEAHGHAHGPPQTETLTLEERVLSRNDHLAGHVRSWLDDRGICALNLMSSPGAGKTSLLERTIRELPGLPEWSLGAGEICVVEGDQETTLDADRIRRAGARAVQVNTGAGCHLDAAMVRRALDELDPAPGALVFVENVGNLVCPALFDLGEAARVVLVSVTEGDDKPVKYPHMFATADLVVLNKVDLLPYVDFDVARFAGYVHGLRPTTRILPLSVRNGEDVGSWYAWLAEVSGPSAQRRSAEGARHGTAVGS